MHLSGGRRHEDGLIHPQDTVQEGHMREGRSPSQRPKLQRQAHAGRSMVDCNHFSLVVCLQVQRMLTDVSILDCMNLKLLQQQHAHSIHDQLTIQTSGAWLWTVLLARFHDKERLLQGLIPAIALTGIYRELR